MIRRLLLACCLLLCSCATLPYQTSGDLYPLPSPIPGKEQVERGQKLWLVDGLGHYVFSLPEKVLLFNDRMGKHDISPVTEEAIKRYLEDNDLKEVKVRLNGYAPASEWGRLFKNKSVGAGWRYTLGILTCVVYTIFPGRLFGGDNFNPYTNTISLYSDSRAVALHELGHAKDFASKKWKGTWAAARLLPLWALRDEAVASNDAVSYTVANFDGEQERRAYKILYPAYGTYIGGEAAQWIPGWRYAALIAAIPGHIVGRIKAAGVEDRPPVAPTDGSAMAESVVAAEEVLPSAEVTSEAVSQRDGAQ